MSKLDHRYVIAAGYAVDAADFCDGKKNILIFVDDGKIEKIVEDDSQRSIFLKFTNDKNINIYDATDYLICPGFVNAHTHVPMSFFRGLGHEEPEMIENFLFPAEKKLTFEAVEKLSYSSIYDGLKSGVTTFVDHYYFSKAVGQALESFGLRGFIGETLADLGSAFPKRWAKKELEDFYKNWPFSSKIQPFLAPHAADTVSFDFLKELAAFARTHRLPIHMHLAQTAGEVKRVKKECQLTPTEKVKKAGILGEKTILTHCLHMTPKDLKMIYNARSTIAFCPISQIIYERLAPIEQFLSTGIPVAIGSDAAASNDSFHILTETKFAGLMMRDRGVAAKKRSVKELLKMITVNPLKALGVNNLGLIKKGYLCDLNFFKVGLEHQPMFRPLENLFFSFSEKDLKHVMIEGKFVLKDGQLSGAKQNLQSYLSEYEIWTRKLY